MPGLYEHTERAANTRLTAAIYNEDHQNHIDHLEPQYIDDASANLTEYRATSAPGEVGSETLPTTLQTEIQQLRYVLNRFMGTTHWYEAPTSSGLGDPINYRAVGGLPGGVLDNRAIFNAAVATARASGRALRIPAGQYAFTTNGGLCASDVPLIFDPLAEIVPGAGISVQLDCFMHLDPGKHFNMDATGSLIWGAFVRRLPVVLASLWGALPTIDGRSEDPDDRPDASPAIMAMFRSIAASGAPSQRPPGVLQGSVHSFHAIYPPEGTGLHSLVQNPRSNRWEHNGAVRHVGTVIGDPPSLADGEEWESPEFDVTAGLPDYMPCIKIEIASGGGANGLNGLTANAYKSSTNKARLLLMNATGGVVDLPETMFRVEFSLPMIAFIATPQWITGFPFGRPIVAANPEMSAVYVCREDHISGVWADDLAAGKWQLLYTLQHRLDPAHTLMPDAPDTGYLREVIYNGNNSTMALGAELIEQVVAPSTINAKTTALWTGLTGVNGIRAGNLWFNGFDRAIGLGDSLRRMQAGTVDISDIVVESGTFGIWLQYIDDLTCKNLALYTQQSAGLRIDDPLLCTVSQVLLKDCGGGASPDESVIIQRTSYIKGMLTTDADWRWPGTTDPYGVKFDGLGKINLSNFYIGGYGTWDREHFTNPRERAPETLLRITDLTNVVCSNFTLDGCSGKEGMVSRGALVQSAEVEFVNLKVENIPQPDEGTGIRTQTLSGKRPAKVRVSNYTSVNTAGPAVRQVSTNDEITLLNFDIAGAFFRNQFDYVYSATTLDVSTAVFTDLITDAFDAGAGDVPFLSTSSLGPNLLVGSKGTFDRLRLDISTAMVGGAPVYEYATLVNGVLTWQPLDLIFPVAGGTDYLQGDTITVSGGTSSSAMQAEVATTDPLTGAVSTLRVISWGVYTVWPTGTLATTGGSGTGLTVSIPTAFTAQQLLTWVFPIAWERTEINGIEAYWIRLRASSLPSTSPVADRVLCTALADSSITAVRATNAGRVDLSHGKIHDCPNVPDNQGVLFGSAANKNIAYVSSTRGFNMDGGSFCNFGPGNDNGGTAGLTTPYTVAATLGATSVPAADGLTSGNITLPGARAGDGVRILTYPTAANVYKLGMKARVSASNTVVIDYSNPTGGAIDAAGDYTLRLDQRA